MKTILGIDVSEHNGTLDWDAIKASGVKFAIIRIGIGSNYESQDDRQAERNMDECERLDIPYGVYLYSYALTDEQVVSEYEHTKRMIAGRKPALGIAFDMEDADDYKFNHGLNPYDNGDTLTRFCSKFAELVQDDGFISFTYANSDYFRNVLDEDRISGKKWLAVWYDNNGPEDSPKAGETIWQFSSDGEIDGSSSRTDVNYFIDTNFFDMITDVDGDEIPDVPEAEDPIPERPIENVGQLYKVGDHVTYNKIYYSSCAWDDGLKPLYTEGVITHVYAGARHPYLLDNCTGFVDDNCITGYYNEPENDCNCDNCDCGSSDSLNVGDIVRMQQGAPVYGEAAYFSEWVYEVDLFVREVKGDRIVVSTVESGAITGAVDAKYLTKI